MARKWEEGMGEISGFGGGYEAVCRAMVLAGIDWLDNHPEAAPVFSGYENVFGIVNEDNDDAKGLIHAMTQAPVWYNGELIQRTAGMDCTGAMVHAAVNHCLAYRKLGWDEYVRIMKEPSKE